MEIASDNRITERDSSNLMEAAEPMENSSMESEPAEEVEESGDEIEESGDENELSSDEIEEINCAKKRYVEEVNAYFRSKWITPQWDVDSFDNLKFDASQEEERTEYMDEKDVQDWLRFRRQHIENKGFYVDTELWPMYSYTNYKVIEDLEKSAVLGQTYREFFEDMVCLCVQRFNQDQKGKDEDLEFVRVVGGVVKMAGRPKAYITFMAREKPPDGPDVEYQAKVWSESVKGINSNYFKHHPILCRRAPPSKPSN